MAEPISHKIIVPIVVGVTLAVVGGIVTVVTSRLTDDKPDEPEHVASLTAFDAETDLARSSSSFAILN